MSRPVFCRACVPARKLGDVEGKTITIIHRKRTIAAFLPVKIKCERCGKVTTIPAPVAKEENPL